MPEQSPENTTAFANERPPDGQCATCGKVIAPFVRPPCLGLPPRWLPPPIYCGPCIQKQKMEKTNLENENEIGLDGAPLFDNPLALFNLKLKHKVLEKEDVGRIFNVSPKTIERMMADSSLPFHYVGNKPRFYLDEVMEAFRNDSLDIQRRTHDQKDNQQGWNDTVPGQSNGSGPKTLQEIRVSARRHNLDK